jgi:ribosomal protein S18 acetylase RimI-like enzyme
MIIRLANKSDAVQIARLHKKEINQGFLSDLGDKFLAKLYEAMTSSPYAFVVVADDSDRIIGFIGACTDVKRFYKHFLKKYFFQCLIILAPKMISFSIFKKIIETLKYPKRKNKSHLPESELFTVAVEKEFQGQGLIQNIFKAFILEMRNRDINEFKVVVGERLPRAIAFYEKMGFRFHSLIHIHENKPSRIYVYTINHANN